MVALNEAHEANTSGRRVFSAWPAVFDGRILKSGRNQFPIEKFLTYIFLRELLIVSGGRWRALKSDENCDVRREFRIDGLVIE